MAAMPSAAAGSATAPPRSDPPWNILALRQRLHHRASGGDTVWTRRRSVSAPAWVSLCIVHPGPAVVPGRWHRPFSASTYRVLARAAVPDDTEGGRLANSRSDVPPPDPEASKNSDLHSGDGYVGLFVRMLGLDNDPLDREQAITTLCKYSHGGKHCIDAVMKYPGCVSLVTNLLKSDSKSVREAAAGLLRKISSISLYMESVAGSGAIEEIAGLLCLSDLTPEVKEHSLCTLWNLSTDEKLRTKIKIRDIVPILINYLEDEEVKVVEAAGGVLENLALSHHNHSIMVEYGVIPKLAKLLKNNSEGHKIIRKEAKNALLELSKDEYYKILVIEEGLILVPLVGAAAYKSFRPVSRSWPSLPDGTEIQHTAQLSRYGASELLLGLNIREKGLSLEETKIHAIVGRSQQQFLARIGAIELEAKDTSLLSSAYDKQTILPWMDGVARLVLILGLKDVSAVMKAAYAIADASINEHLMIAFKEAGAVRLLVQLLGHSNGGVREAAIHGLEKLSVSSKVCKIIEAEKLLDPLVNVLTDRRSTDDLREKILTILGRIFDPAKSVKDKEVGSFTKTEDSLFMPEALIRVHLMRPGVPSSVISDERLKAMSLLHSFTLGGDDIYLILRKKVLDSGLISILIEVMKMPLPCLQKMSASILEYFAQSEEHVSAMTTAGIESGVASIYQPSFMNDMLEKLSSFWSYEFSTLLFLVPMFSNPAPCGRSERVDNIQVEVEINAVVIEESGSAIAATSKLLTKLLDYEIFRHNVDPTRFISLLRNILKSEIPLRAKDWVAACLVKMESLVRSDTETEYPIDMEVTIYETIPRLIEQVRTSFSEELQEAAVVELNTIISKGVAECTRAVVSAGGIPLLVKLIEEGGIAAEASLAILYNISMDIENHPAIVSAGAVPVLKRVVLSERPQWTLALRLLRTLPT